MLNATERNNGSLLRGTKMEPREEIPTLADLGIDKKISSLAQAYLTIVKSEAIVRPMAKDLFTVTQAAKLLKVTRQNIYDAIDRGRLISTRVGSMLLIQRSALERYSKSRKRTGRPPSKKIT